jgi:hypothetical protein
MCVVFLSTFAALNSNTSLPSNHHPAPTTMAAPIVAKMKSVDTITQTTATLTSTAAASSFAFGRAPLPDPFADLHDLAPLRAVLHNSSGGNCNSDTVGLFLILVV